MNEIPRTPPRRLGLFSATALVIANMVGVGVFTTSGFALADLGDPVTVLGAWLVAGVLAVCGALSYGALGRVMPHSGGEYLFLSRIVHPLAGFLAGWVSLLAGFTGAIAAAALGLEAYLESALAINLPQKWIGTGAILAAGVLHGVRLGPGVVVQNLSVSLKLVLIAVFVVVGFLRLPVETGSRLAMPSGLDVGAFGVTLVWISFSYAGWNAAVYVASEVRDPGRNLNRSLWLGALLVVAVYLALNAVFVFAAPFEAIAGREDVGAAAAEALGGAPFRTAMSLLVALALFTSVSSMVLAGPRVYTRMAADGLFPRVFAHVSDVPTLAVALQTALAIVVVWLSGLKQLLGYIGFTLGISSAVTVSSLLWLRVRKGPDRVRVPGFPWLQLVYVGFTVAASTYMVILRPREAVWGLVTVAAGVPVYWWLRRRLQVNGRFQLPVENDEAPS